MKRTLRLAVWVWFFALANCWLPSCSPFTHDDVFTDEHLLTANHDQLKATTISPILDEPLAPGRNVLWCGTFQLAWNEACGLVGEDLHFDGEPAIVKSLNAKAFLRKDLDEESFIALAGFVRDGIFTKIDTALKDKFHGAASPHHLPSPDLSQRPQDIVAYSYLFKHLKFPTPFEKVDDGMSFCGQQVEAFGLPGYKPDYEKRYIQVFIHDYRSADDFVIELETQSEGDHLILAKIPPAETLGSAVAAVQKRLRKKAAPTMTPGDVLLAPKMNFDLTAEYSELYGKTLRVKNPAVAKDLEILAAGQNVRFQIDEKGVRLRSEAHLSFGCSNNSGPIAHHLLIFDKPFLVMMQRQGATQPYFALWLADAELLEKK